MTWGEVVGEIIFISSVPVWAEVAFWRLKISSQKKEKRNISFQPLFWEEIKQNVCRDMEVIYEISFRKKSGCTDKSN